MTQIKTDLDADALSAIKSKLYESMDSKLATVITPLNEAAWENSRGSSAPVLLGMEKDAANAVAVASQSCGGDLGVYDQGVGVYEFKHKQSVEDFTAFCDASGFVDTYEIEILSTTEITGYPVDDGYDFDSIKDDHSFTFNVIVYMDPMFVQFDPEEVDEIYDDENGMMMEVRRTIRINSRGTKSIKMKCMPGFKWDGTRRACVKITGSALAISRKSHRKAVLTKKSKGNSFRARVVRKQKKARRFRKMLGL